MYYSIRPVQVRFPVSFMGGRAEIYWEDREL